MRIVVENVTFPYDLGCRVLKLKHKNDCPFEQLSDIWDDIKPLTFKDIAQLENLEQRRVAIFCLGLERLVSEVNPKLINRKTLKKETTWVTESGELVTKKFNDTYELYEVKGSYLGKDRWGRDAENVYYVKCKDTSTDREYMIWVDIRSVYSINNRGVNSWRFDINKVNAIDCISWTIQTDVEKGGIEKIIRQGDCILIKTKPNAKFGNVRHLTSEEYRTLLVAES